MGKTERSKWREHMSQCGRRASFNRCSGDCVSRRLPVTNYGDFLGVGPYNVCVSLRYSIVLHKSKEGYAVSCPALPGCWSQGASEEEALENIRDAIREYLAAIKETLPAEDVREVEVTV
jgi:predicted RNase H-like HicB family nuclease